MGPRSSLAERTERTRAHPQTAAGYRAYVSSSLNESMDDSGIAIRGHVWRFGNFLQNQK